jgi:hypothetical protein
LNIADIVILQFISIIKLQNQLKTLNLLCAQAQKNGGDGVGQCVEASFFCPFLGSSFGQAKEEQNNKNNIGCKFRQSRIILQTLTVKIKCIYAIIVFLISD